MEMQFREDINRLDHLVKESKKAAAQQVLEITLRAKAASEEVDELKAQRAELVASEKKAYAEVEKVKIEAEMNKKNYEEMQQQMGKEMTAIRREIAEYRTKGKLQSEAKTAMEMELMTVRLDYTKQENELHRMSEWIKDSDVKIAAANEQTQLAKQEAALAIEEQKKLKSQVHLLLLTHSLLLTLTHSLLLTLTHSLTYLLTHLLTHSLTHSLTHALTYLLTYLLTHTLTHSLTH